MKTLFYIEDDNLDREEVMIGLQKSFGTYRMIFLEDAFGIIPKISQHRPEIMIFDLSLPGLDGIQILEHLENHHREVSVIITSGHGLILRDIKKRNWSFPFLECLEKPFRVKDLLQLVHFASEKNPDASFRDTNLITVFQFVRSEGKSGRVDFTSSEGIGHFFYDESHLIYAAFNHLAGVEALIAMSATSSNTMRVYYSRLPALEANLFYTADELLLHLCQRIDETQFLTAPQDHIA